MGYESECNGWFKGNWASTLDDMSFYCSHNLNEVLSDTLLLEHNITTNVESTNKHFVLLRSTTDIC